MQEFYTKPGRSQDDSQEQKVCQINGLVLALKIRNPDQEEEKKKNPDKLWIVWIVGITQKQKGEQNR